MDLMQLTATLGLDASGFEAGVNKSRGIFGGLSGTISAGTVALGSLMADVVKKGANMVVDLGKTALDYNMQMEDYTANFRVMLGSTEAAAAKVEALKEFAAKTPFEMTDLASATQTLLAFGIEAERTDEIMQMLGDVSLGNSQKFASLATVFGQVSSSGKLLGQDLMQFINQGFNPLQVIADKTGASMSDLKKVMSGEKTSKDFNKMVKAAQKEVRKLGDGASDSAKLLAQIGEDGMISAEMVEEAFRIATEEGGQFYNGMEESSKTLSGLMSTLSDNWTALVGDVFKPVSDFMQTTLIPRAIEAVDTLQKAFDEGGFRGMLSAAAGMIQPYVDSAFSALTTMADNAIDTGAGILAGVYNGLTGGDVSAEDIKLFFSGIAESVGETFDAVINLGASLLSGIYYGLTGDEVGAEGIVKTIQDVLNDPKAAIDALVTSAGSFFTTVFAALQGDTQAQSDLSEMLTGAFDVIPQTIGKIVENAGNFFTDILTALGADAEKQEEIKSTISGVFSAGADAIGSLVEKAGTIFTSIIDALSSDDTVAQSITQAFIDAFDGAAQTIATLVGEGGKMIGAIAAEIADPEKALALYEAVKAAFKDAVDYIAQIPSAAAAWGANLITNFIDGVVAKYEEIKWKIIDTVNSIKGLFTGVEISIGANGAGAKGFAVGLDYVPSDNYPALLHRGEAVLTRSEAEDWRAGEGGRGTTIIVNQYITSEAQTAADLMREARWEQERGVLMAGV